MRASMTGRRAADNRLTPARLLFHRPIHLLSGEGDGGGGQWPCAEQQQHQ